MLRQESNDVAARVIRSCPGKEWVRFFKRGFVARTEATGASNDELLKAGSPLKDSNGGRWQSAVNEGRKEEGRMEGRTGERTTR